MLKFAVYKGTGLYIIHGIVDTYTSATLSTGKLLMRANTVSNTIRLVCLTDKYEWKK